MDYFGINAWETPFAIVNDVAQTPVAQWHSYGDMPPWGKGPSPTQIYHEDGYHTYLKNEFPEMDYLEECYVVDIDPGIMAELAYTGRKVFGPEAKEINLVNRTYTDKDAMMEEVMGLAKEIASKSPLCIRGTKEILLYTRDHSVEESLNYMVAWNASMLLSNDIFEAMAAYMQKRPAEFKG